MFIAIDIVIDIDIDIDIEIDIDISPAETPECWTPQFQTEAIFADNFPSKLSSNLEKFSANITKLSANMAVVWNCRLQHSGVSAGLIDIAIDIDIDIDIDLNKLTFLTTGFFSSASLSFALTRGY